jgi:hypothetical protein
MNASQNNRELKAVVCCKILWEKEINHLAKRTQNKLRHEGKQHKKKEKRKKKKEQKTSVD